MKENGNFAPLPKSTSGRISFIRKMSDETAKKLGKENQDTYINNVFIYENVKRNFGFRR